MPLKLGKFKRKKWLVGRWDLKKGRNEIIPNDLDVDSSLWLTI
jgi:hypothetical protein